jgi:serine protease Do
VTCKALVVLSLWGLADAAPAPPRAPAAPSPPPYTEAPRPRGALSAQALAKLADRARPAVVHVRGTLSENASRAAGRPAGGATMSVGSGFIVDKAGYIVTNEHVVRGTVQIRVRLYDGREFASCVAGTDELADIALLKIEPKGTLPVLPLADSDAVRVGEVAVAIGSPFGFAHSVTAGIVSAKDRVVDQGNDRVSGDNEEPAYSFYIQTDASINVGNSGGPLVDAAGAAIGVNAAFWGGPQPAPGVGFAIPINVVKLLLPRLRDTGEAPRSFLGIESQPLTPELASAFHTEGLRGALIASVEPASAAAAAGLEVGDVVTTWNGHTLATRDDFRIFAQLTAPGTKVQVGLLRAGKPLERALTTRPAANANHPRHPSDCRGQAQAPVLAEGFEVEEVPAARASGLPGGKGVQVARVQGGAGREADLQVGDVILRAGTSAVHTPAELRRVLDEWKGEQPLPLLIRHQGYDLWTALPRR